MNKQEVALRLRRFGTTCCGTMRAFAQELDMTPAALSSSYLSGRSIPGGEILAKCFLLGCDVNWLLFGIGRYPEPMTLDERREWIDQCQKQVDYHTRYAELEQQVMDEMKVQHDKYAALSTQRKAVEPKKKYRKEKKK